MKNVPRHIAIIMDGNGRWAAQRKQNRIFGHRKGAIAVRNTVKACRKRGVEYLTLYAFSEENWNRPKIETSTLMRILKTFLISERKLLQENDVRLRVIGDISKLPNFAQKTLYETMALTALNKSMTLVLALSYGGRNEITRAVQALAEKVQKKELQSSEITDQMISDHLDTRDYPDPDLLIRTSGEMRTSNFLPWQLTYTEFYVTQTLWPDFNDKELDLAIADFLKRERRFGKTGKQLKEEKSDGSWRQVTSSY